MPKYSLIVEYLKAFEQTLDDNHEVWITFPDYDCSFLLQATENGKDEFIAFELLSKANEYFAVIQHYSQLNFAVFSKEKAQSATSARRIGFRDCDGL